MRKSAKTTVESVAKAEPSVSELHACLEDNPWAPILSNDLDPADPLVKRLRKMDPSAPVVNLRTDPFTLRLGDVDDEQHDYARRNSRLVFHTMGCSGDPVPGHADPQDWVAGSLAAQIKGDNAPCFLYHLGDITYKPPPPAKEKPIPVDQGYLYADEFYTTYKRYSRPIFVIPGNHDGKYHESEEGRVSKKRSAMWHYLLNFCSEQNTFSPDNADRRDRRIDPRRVSVGQPYPFFVLNTPLAYIVGLYTNVVNGGLLDDPLAQDYPNGPQYRWLVARLAAIKVQNARREARSPARPRKAVIVAAHYPPYSGAANFAMRGAPYLGNQEVLYKDAEPLGTTLTRAFTESGLRPDLLISAHAHLYQRLTYTFASDGWELPCLIVGCGGHSPIEKIATPCSDPDLEKPLPPLPPVKDVLPKRLAKEMGKDHVTLNAYADGDADFGFARISVTPEEIAGEFFVAGHISEARDSFRLDLREHKVK